MTVIPLGLLCSTTSLADKPPKPDDPPDDDATKYNVIEVMPGMHGPDDISNSLDGDVFVAGNSSEFGKAAAAWGCVNSQGEATSGCLPDTHPPFDLAVGPEGVDGFLLQTYGSVSSGSRKTTAGLTQATPAHPTE